MKNVLNTREVTKMNNIMGVAKVKNKKIVYTYVYDEKKYVIETPKTDLNQGVEDGEIVSIMLGIMPVTGGKPSESGKNKMYMINDE